MTPKGQVARAIALAKKTRNKAKNVARNVGRSSKKAVRVIDDVFSMNPDLVSMAGLNRTAMAVKSIRNVIAPKVSPCLKKWYSCLTSPFSQDAMGACIPSGDTHSSQRAFGFMRFDFTIGTNKVGWVAISPNVSNNAPQVYYTNELFSGTDLSILTANNIYSIGVSSLAAGNLPFPSSFFTAPTTTESSCQGRIVGGGIRVQYTGKTVDQAGLSYFYTDPQHITAINAPVNSNLVTMNAALLGTYQETIIKPVSREPCENTLAPMTQLELEYFTPIGRSSIDSAKDTYPWGETTFFNNGFTTNAASSGGSSIGIQCACPVSVFYVSGATPGTTFHVEYGLHVEYVGRASEGQRMPADSDPVGVQNMMAAISRATIAEGGSRTTNFPLRLKKSYADVVASSAHATRL